MRVAVTGATGFVGHHLIHELVEAGHEPVGVSNVDEADLGVPFVSCDLTRSWPDELDGVDAVVHLAGLSAVGPSFSAPQEYVETNSAMVTTMCEALVAAGSKARVLVVSSGAVYDAFQTQPIPETGAVATNSPYVVSKLLVENLASYYGGRGLDVVVARPFNHIGPGQKDGFLLPDLVTEATAAAAAGRPMRVGDLSTSRDYTDVRDVARAYRLLLEAKLGEDFATERVFNICSGRARSGNELCDLALAELGLADLERSVDESRIRPNDPRSITGDHERLSRVTGWAAEHEVEDTVHDYVADRLASLSPPGEG
jgi:GDP-4-dehydro-6-deoxy-D-mannose reductase